MPNNIVLKKIVLWVFEISRFPWQPIMLTVNDEGIRTKILIS